MKKNSVLSFILGVTVTTATMISFPSFAEGVLKTLQIAENTVKVTVNGVLSTSSNYVIEGRTYLQVRDMCNLLEKDLVWDNVTKTVSINDKVIKATETNMLPTKDIEDSKKESTTHKPLATPIPTPTPNPVSGEQSKIVPFDANTVATQLKVINEYTWNTDYSKYIAIVLKNTSEFTVKPRIQLKLFNSSGEVVGAKNQEEYAFGPDNEMVFIFNEKEFDNYKYIISANEDEYYSDVVSLLEVNTSTTKNKAIVEITNKGKKDAEFVEYKALFLKDGKVVDYGTRYCVDTESKIKVGSTEISECDTGSTFDSVKVYLNGRGKK